MMLSFIFNLGVKPGMDDYLQRQTMLSNQIAVFLLSVPLFFSLFTYFNSPPLFPLAVGCTAFPLLVLLLNFLGLQYLSRFLLSIMPISLAQVFYASFAHVGEVIVSAHVMVFSFSILPFVMFDLREKILLFASFGTAVLIFFSFPMLNALIELDFDNSVWKEDFIVTMDYIFAVFVVLGTLLILKYADQYAQRQNAELLVADRKKSEEVERARRELEASLDEIQKAREEDKKRNWISENLANFSKLMRQEQDSEKLFDRLLAGITKAMEANQSALFVVEEAEEGKPLIKMAACYAYGRKKFLEQAIEPGVGLVGQCFYEKKRYFLKEIPENYINITSGLGESKPNTILIIPLIANETVQGMVEMASFQDIEGHQVEFLEKMGENLASFIISQRINQTTKKLLEQSQEQTEELKMREEEMRQNMEELHATQESMRRKELDYQKRIEALERQLSANAWAH